MTTTSQQQLRIRYRKIRAELTRIKRDHATRTISQTVINSSWFQRSQNIACYLSTSDEVGTWQIIERALRMKKRIFAPIVKKNNVMQFQELKAKSVLRKNDYGLFEPRDGQLINANNLDVVITPLVAFDHLNNRVGMG
ncbi:MAG: 5-formyltetrahydrofolate cyclo-ligase, partial [Woeseiales bacterium]